MGWTPKGAAWRIRLVLLCDTSVSFFAPRPVNDSCSDFYYRYFEKFEKYSPNQAWPDVDVTLRGAQGLVDGKRLVYH